MYLILNVGKCDETPFNSEEKWTQSHAFDPFIVTSGGVYKSIQPRTHDSPLVLTLGNCSSAIPIQGELVHSAGFLTIKADAQNVPDSLNFKKVLDLCDLAACSSAPAVHGLFTMSCSFITIEPIHTHGFSHQHGLRPFCSMKAAQCSQHVNERVFLYVVAKSFYPQEYSSRGKPTEFMPNSIPQMTDHISQLTLR